MTTFAEIRPPAPGVLTPPQAQFLLVLSGRAIENTGARCGVELEFNRKLDCIGEAIYTISRGDHPRSLFAAYCDYYYETKDRDPFLSKDILDELAERNKVEYYKKQQLSSVTRERVQD